MSNANKKKGNTLASCRRPGVEPTAVNALRTHRRLDHSNPKRKRGRSGDQASFDYAAPLLPRLRFGLLCPPLGSSVAKKENRSPVPHERAKYAFYDCLIIAGAKRAGAETLYTEDLQDGQVLDGLTIVNPFR